MLGKFFMWIATRLIQNCPYQKIMKSLTGKNIKALVTRAYAN